jgi:hypothetical protein
MPGDNLLDIISKWIIIWSFISGVIGASIKFIFEKIIPTWQLRKATRVAIQKYSLPLLQYSSAVEDSIFRVVKSEINYNDWNTFLRLKTL